MASRTALIVGGRGSGGNGTGTGPPGPPGPATTVDEGLGITVDGDPENGYTVAAHVSDVPSNQLVIVDGVYVSPHSLHNQDGSINVDPPDVNGIIQLNVRISTDEGNTLTPGSASGATSSS